ncbi:MAG TPA: hypothetical protein VL200_11420 [Lacunisphaera sp.]|jgi:hypothetical protein|nr:hypothetical protein [Lacunisphaera sp.]
MRLLRPLFAAALSAAFALSVSAAESATPAGNWQWTATTPQGPFEVTARFDYKDGALTGSVTVPGNEAPLSAASYKDGVIAFTVIREMHGMQFEIRYSGKLEGDTITGTIDRPSPGGDREQIEWKASRAK